MISQLQEMCIDYQLLARANYFYKIRGYTQIEVPWIVEAEASLSTINNTDYVFVVSPDEHLVGSAEQGFIQLMIKHSEKLKNGQLYQAISPCFRRETLDETHSQWFMKLELFCKTDKDTLKILKTMISDAANLFKYFGIETQQCVTSHDKKFPAIDLMHGSLELGSYGIRKISDEYWIYGTGLALPRTQLASGYRLT